MSENEIRDTDTVVGYISTQLNAVLHLKGEYAHDPTGVHFKLLADLEKELLSKHMNMLVGKISRNTETFKKAVGALRESISDTKDAVKDLSKTASVISKIRKALKLVDKAIDLLA